MPTVDIPDKRCIKCNVIICEKNWRIDSKSKKPLFKKCIHCECNAKWCKVKYTPEQYSIANRNCQIIKCQLWRKNNKSYFSQRARNTSFKSTLKWMSENKDKVKKIRFKTAKKSRDALDNSYVKKVITNSCNLSFNDIPQDLIELKRKQLLLTRKIKNNGKDQHSNKNN